MPLIATFSIIIILAVVSPGPDFIIVSKNTLLYSKQHGRYTAFGIACSNLIHSMYCLLGLGIVVSKSLLLFSIIKYIGGGYLIYLGLTALFKKKDSVAENVTASLSKSQSLATSFRQGFLCNLLNPKTIMFYLAIFSLSLQQHAQLLLQLTLSTEIVLIHLFWFSLVSHWIGNPAIKNGLSKCRHIIDRCFGAILIIFGLAMFHISMKEQ